MRALGTATTRTVLSIEDVSVHYSVAAATGRGRATLRAVDGVSLTVSAGETLGVVGESGCGKSTLGRAALLLTRPVSGRVHLGDVELTTLGGRELRRQRRHMQMIFQDPASSLDPRVPVWSAITEPLRIHGRLGRRGARDRAGELLETVGMSDRLADRLPHELSGGQRQRVAIARALSLEPRVVVCDEAVSALDVSVRAQVVNLLEDLQDRFGMAYVFIGHDLGVVKHVSDRIAVMYLGRIVESLPSIELQTRVLHPYTRSLLSAVPRADADAPRRERIVLRGEVPSPADPPTGCHLHTRCPLAVERCRVEVPALAAVAPGHSVACHRWQELVDVPVTSLSVTDRTIRSASTDRAAVPAEQGAP